MSGRPDADADGHVEILVSEVLAASAGAFGANQDDLANAKTYAKAMAALYGAIIFWHGALTQFYVGVLRHQPPRAAARLSLCTAFTLDSLSRLKHLPTCTGRAGGARLLPS